MNFIIAIIFISVVGTLLHFTYDYSNHNEVVGIFSAVNESTWEHIKMGLTPTFLWSLYDGFAYGMKPNYFSAKLISLLMIIIVIVVIFYGTKLIFKKSFLILDISSFFIAIISSQLMMKYILSLNGFGYVINVISLILIIILIGFYLLSTIKPLKNFLFLDPLTKKYGIKGHKH